MNTHPYAPYKHKPLALAFKLSLPVFLSYFPLGLVFGALFAKLHTHWFLAPIMSIFAYSGAVQFVTLGLVQEHASYFFIFISIVFIAARNVFYGLSLLERFKMPTFKKCLSIFLLVDTNYALMLETRPYDDKKKDNAFCLWLAFLIYLYWVIGTLAGSLFGGHIPGVDNLEFVLVAFFAIMLLEQNRSLLPISIGLISFVAALLLVPESSLLILGIVLSCILLVIVHIVRRRFG